MKSLKLRITILLFSIFYSFSYSQNFTIDGVTGITFNESNSDYSINITNDFAKDFKMVIGN